VKFTHRTSARLLRRQGERMRRREILTVFGGAALWPLAGIAQQRSAAQTRLSNE
jgi:hypothetical protein